MTITISDKAKAISALNNEIELLKKQAEASNVRHNELFYCFQEDIRALSNNQVKILDKMIAMEDAIQKIISKSIAY